MSKASGNTKKEVKSTRQLGTAWGQEIQDFVTEEGSDLAKRRLASGDHGGEDFVEVRVPVILHLKYARRGEELDPPTIQCACVFKDLGGGSSVCTCTGPDAASCDCELVVV